VCLGLWPAKTDANGQTTTFIYDSLGRETSQTLPGETPGLTTLGTANTVFCTTTTVTARAFYDGMGHLVMLLVTLGI